MEAKKQFSKIGFLLILATIVINGIQLLASAIFKDIPAITNSKDLYLLALMLPCYAFGYPLILFLFKKVPLQISGEPKKMKFGSLLAAFFMTYALTYVCNFIGTFILTIVEDFKGAPVENVLANLLNEISPFTTLVVAVILAPIFEELLFRKAIIDRTAKYGEGISIVFSGFMFGLFHGNFNQFAYAMFLGMFFGFIYIKTKNILYPIILHFITNFMGSIIPMLVMNNTRYLEYEEKLAELMASGEYTDAASTALALEYASDITIVFTYIFMLFTMVIIGIILFIVKRKKFVLEAGEAPIEKGEHFKTACLNPGVIAFIVFWVAMIIWQMVG